MVTASSACTPPIIAVLSLVVAIVALFIARANTHRQIRATARQAWMRDFVEQLAALFTSLAILREHARTHTSDNPEKEVRLAEINDELTLRWHTVRLLVAEKGPQYATFLLAIERAMNAPPLEAGARVHDMNTGATDILQRELAAIEDLGLWHKWRRDLVGLRPWRHIKNWARGTPRFSDPYRPPDLQ